MKGAHTPLGTMIFNIYDQDVYFFVRLTEGQRQKQHYRNLILILIYVNKAKTKNCRKYKFRVLQKPVIEITHIALLLPMNLVCVMTEELTGTLAAAKMLLTKQQLG